MFGASLKATNSSFQEGMTFCRSIYVEKAMKLLAFIFEQPSYNKNDHLVTWSIFVRCLMPSFVYKTLFPPRPKTPFTYVRCIFM